LRHLKGVPLNFSGIIIGKITKNPIFKKNKKKYILAIPQIDENVKRYKAIITNTYISKEKANKFKQPIVHSVENLDSLNEEDIVFVNMSNGDIFIVYERNSLHNSILASTDCNCRCIMCPQDLYENSPENIKYNLEIIRFIDKNTKVLGVTGGEPLIQRKNFIKILKNLKKYLPETEIQILTNGILLRDDTYVKQIVRLGLKKLLFCIPLYADTDKEHDFIMQKNGAFEDAILGLYNLAANNIPVEIRTVVMRHNYKRLLQLAEFIYRNLTFAIHIAFMGMEVEAKAKRNIKKLWTSPIEYAPYLREAVLFLAERNMNVSVYNEQLCLMPREIWKFMCKSISEWKNIYLEKCNKCRLKYKCGGFFANPIEEHKKLITPLDF